MNESPPPPPTPSTIARLRGKGGRYHHGNLRGALIVAAANLLEVQGEAGLTLRALADCAGVSRAAPYRHFADKEALLATLAGEGYRVLDRELERAATAAAEGPARLQAIALAYVAFARRHHRMFRLMFANDAILAGEGSERLLARLTDAVASMRGTPDDGAAAIAAWSLIHGLATLRLDDRMPAADKLGVESIVALLVDGIS